MVTMCDLYESLDSGRLVLPQSVIDRLSVGLIERNSRCSLNTSANFFKDLGARDIALC